MLMNPYSYPVNNTSFNLTLKETNKNWLHYEVDFPSAQPTRYEKINTAYGEYFRPASGKSKSYLDTALFVARSISNANFGEGRLVPLMIREIWV